LWARTSRHKRRAESPSAVDPAVEADHTALTGISDEPHLAALPRLEARRSPGWDVEAKTARLLAVKGECRIGLVEMIMRADLDRAIAGVGDNQGHSRAAGVDLDLTGRGDDFSRDHRVLPVIARSHRRRSNLVHRNSGWREIASRCSQ
jgi:hypothetical protein